MMHKERTCTQTLSIAFAIVVLCGSAVVIDIAGCACNKPQNKEERVQASAADLRTTLQATVKDAGRLQQMLAITDRAESELDPGAAELARLLKEQDRLNADYNAGRDAFQKLGERIQTLRGEQRSRIIGTRQALAQLATDDEWKKIASLDLAILGN